MLQEDKVYTTLCALFTALLILGNLLYQKFVFLPVLPFYTLELSVGAILYPATFLVSDLITEFFGKAKARFCVRLAIAMNVMIAIAVMGMDSLEATQWSKIDNDTFHKIFGLYNVAFFGSMIACFIAQLIDIMIYSWIRKMTGDKWLWLRNNGSTMISLFIDTTIVISILTYFDVLPIERMGTIILNSYLFKFIFITFSTPLFYLAYFFLQHVLRIIKSKPFPSEIVNTERQKAVA